MAKSRLAHFGCRLKGDLDRKVEEGGDHLVPLAEECVAVLRAVHKLTGEFQLLFPNARNMHRPMSENALSYLLNRAGYHGRHVPHGFRASFSTIMNEWASKHGQKDDRAIIGFMLAHVPANKVEGAYNRAAYLPRRRQIAQIWAQMISLGITEPINLLPLLRQRANPLFRLKI